MIKVLEKLYNDKVILDHGMKVGTELANVLSGGDTTLDKLLTEDNLYQLELASFMNLIETDKTKDRIRHTLATGKPLKEKMIKVLEKLYNEKVILDHGMKVGAELANVLSGGDTTSDKLLTEDNLYQLELTSFMNLIETDSTKDRIRHTLATGKPLVN